MKQILTVSDITERIQALLEDRFAGVWVEGEVSNLRRPASGHCYFTLKDNRCQLRAVLFRQLRTVFSPLRAGRAFALEEGMQVLCFGRITVYAPRGDYQLIVDTVEPLGLGALQKAFEQLKARLEAEGLFDPDNKRPLPYLPRRIAVVTSPTGAVIRDILHITRRRFPSTDIVLYPVRVQGAEAALEIVAAIADLQEVPDVDVIIVARGGGSLEDLAPFNDEKLARAIRRSRIPVVSAVGHETDFTIADFVADLRAPTPSAAAELVVPSRADLVLRLESLGSRLRHQGRRSGEIPGERLLALKDRLADPRRMLTDRRLALDDSLERLERRLRDRLALYRHNLSHQESMLAYFHPRRRIDRDRAHLENLRGNVIAQGRLLLERNREKLLARQNLLVSLSPQAVLDRGYAIAERLPDRLVLRNTEGLHRGTAVAVTLAAGRFQAAVTEIIATPIGEEE